MGQVGDTWYWEPGDNVSLETGLGNFELEGFYGTPLDRPGQSGFANLTGSTGLGIFNISGTADLDRLGVVSSGTISDVNVQVVGSENFELRIGYSADGPYAVVSLFGVTQTVNPDTVGLEGIYDAIGVGVSDGIREQIDDSFGRLSEMKDIIDGAQADAVDLAFQQLYDVAATEQNLGWPQQFQCFLAGTPVILASYQPKDIQDIVAGDSVLSYDACGHLVHSNVTRTFQNEVSHLLDVHGLKVTPGHVTLSGDGQFAGKHVPIIDILLSDGALVKEDASLIRMAINKPVGSLEDQFVKVSYALTSEDAQSGNLQTGEMRVGTLLFDKDGEPVSVLDCIRAEGMGFDPETGLVCREGQSPEPLYFYGPLPRPEDYILRRSRETLEGILADGEWEGSPSELIAQRLRRTASARLN